MLAGMRSTLSARSGTYRLNDARMARRNHTACHCIEMFESMERDGDLIFKGKAAKRMSIDTPRQFLQRWLNRPVTMHGCRSTFRDWCAETGKDPILSEKALMHAVGSAVTQAYQRSDLLEQRRPLMQEWADTILPMNVLGAVLSKRS